MPETETERQELEPAETEHRDTPETAAESLERSTEPRREMPRMTERVE